MIADGSLQLTFSVKSNSIERDAVVQYAARPRPTFYREALESPNTDNSVVALHAQEGCLPSTNPTTSKNLSTHMVHRRHVSKYSTLGDCEK